MTNSEIGSKERQRNDKRRQVQGRWKKKNNTWGWGPRETDDLHRTIFEVQGNLGVKNKDNLPDASHPSLPVSAAGSPFERLETARLRAEKERGPPAVNL